MSTVDTRDRLLLGALAVDGFVVGLLSLAFVNSYVGSVPMPITAVVGGAVNGLLIWLAAGLGTGSLRFLPLAGWLLAVAVGLLGGPGGDALLFGDWRTLLLVAVGVGIPVVLSWSGRLPVARG
ncbi:facilitated glucose transporter [Williamsia sp. MIQD14]|uniref:facilitated glucose transporter n=1 Tax=Williamsia sp. MIQD14 TaxID=3425703 RepID=UPI003D9FF940